MILYRRECVACALRMVRPTSVRGHFLRHVNEGLWWIPVQAVIVGHDARLRRKTRTSTQQDPENTKGGMTTNVIFLS